MRLREGGCGLTPAGPQPGLGPGLLSPAGQTRGNRGQCYGYAKLYAANYTLQATSYKP